MQKQLLLKFAKKYMWSDNAQEAIKYPNKIILKVMDIGTFEDVQLLLKNFEKDFLIGILQKAQIGSMRVKSWYHWHLVLKICDYKNIPALPSKRIY
ncbi:hypothetical protein [Helicobacter sp. 13S00477-4]|uniref:hypothetical protein n=1 Tax=Helicobacter sp. 13S00477-4 TaxID=1905759 RepID=UPI000BA76F9A|nr:hypothetical protein [Helicobacter sp. 13S00477-4]PAF52009.1 hypothetical protein BKH44_04945 [Helicobacter sp. 13S00477-4]